VFKENYKCIHIQTFQTYFYVNVVAILFRSTVVSLRTMKNMSEPLFKVWLIHNWMFSFAVMRMNCIWETHSSNLGHSTGFHNRDWLDQWYSTWDTCTPGGYVQLKKYILFHDKHWIIRARFRVSHRRPAHNDIRFWSVITISLSLSFKWFLSGQLVPFYSTQCVGTWLILDSRFSNLINYFGCNSFNLF
jgi:hypothetical protein